MIREKTLINNAALDFYGEKLEGMDISIKNMYYFIVVAETGNITKAAHRLYTTQSTLSKTILSMEEKLGEELFIHEKRSIKLTRVGDYLYRKWKPFISEYRKCIDGSRRLDDNAAKKIIIGCFPLLDSHRFIQNYTDRIAQIYPDTEIELLRMNYIRLLEHLNAGKADLIFTIETDMPEDMDNYEFKRVYESNYVAVVPIDHPLALRPSINFSQLSGYNIIFSEPNGVLTRQREIVRLIKLYNFKEENIFYVNNDLTAYLSAEHGHGIAIGPRGVYPAHNDRVRRIEINDMEFSIVALWNKNADPGIKNIIHSILE